MAHSSPTFRFSNADDARLRELILYVAAECETDQKFGATKLNKILWWADFLAYAQRGKPITGVEYMRLGNGPAPRRLMIVREAMQRDRDIIVRQVATHGGRVQHRVVPLRSADLTQFSAEEIDLVQHVIQALWRRTAKGVSTLSHGKAWEVAEDHGPIPYEAVFLSDAKINRYDIARTKELARQHNWAVA